MRGSGGSSVEAACGVKKQSRTLRSRSQQNADRYTSRSISSGTSLPTRVIVAPPMLWPTRITGPLRTTWRTTCTTCRRCCPRRSRQHRRRRCGEGGQVLWRLVRGREVARPGRGRAGPPPCTMPRFGQGGGHGAHRVALPLAPWTITKVGCLSRQAGPAVARWVDSAAPTVLAPPAPARTAATRSKCRRPGWRASRCPDRSSVNGVSFPGSGTTTPPRAVPSQRPGQ